MNLQPRDSSSPRPLVHLFCPQCGRPTSIRTMGPAMFAPLLVEIAYSCDGCGCETRVQLNAREP
jgi:hypothetical protein